MFNSQNNYHRPVNYESRNYHDNGNNLPRERRPLRVYVGDMVQITDPRSELVGKYGLVEEINPQNREWQVIVKIGKFSNRMMFRQIRFCTRLSRNKNEENISREDCKQGDINDYIDPLNDDDNKGNLK